MDLLMFDMMGVIYPEAIGGSKEIVRKLYDRIKEPKIEYEDFYSRYKKCIKGEISENVFWENITDHNYKECVKEHLDTFKPDMSIVQIVKKLESRYKIVILSNFITSWAEYILKRDNLYKMFSKKYISESLKKTKPDKQLYEYIFKENKCEKAYLIDDQIKNLVTASEMRYNHGEI